MTGNRTRRTPDPGVRTDSGTPREQSAGGIEAVLFDLDGTLCEYERSPGGVLGVAFERAGVAPFFDVTAYFDRFGEFAGDHDTVATLRANCFAAIAGERGREPALGRAVADAFAAERDQSRVRFVDGAANLLAYVDEQGYDLGLVTNGPPVTQQTKLDSLGVADRFDVTVFAGHGTPSKPHPEPFRRALDAVGAGPAESLFVGDSLGSDIVGARAVGMTSAWVAGDTARQANSETDANNGAVTPEHVIEATGDLLAVLSDPDR
jgi:putative hydrolase of the HAD superfamily